MQPIANKGIELDEGYRIDILVEDKIILELKTVDSVSNVHVAQLLTYLKLSDLQIGYVINFNVNTLKSGIRRVVNKA